jgi:hypothetical protein
MVDLIAVVAQFLLPSVNTDKLSLVADFVHGKADEKKASQTMMADASVSYFCWKETARTGR